MRMKAMLLFSLVLLLVASASSAANAKWEDCGIPLTRKIYYQGVVVSPSTINIASQKSDRSISVNVHAQIKDYTVPLNTTVSLQVLKDDNPTPYFSGPVGDLCSILYNTNRASCPLAEGVYSYSYQYALPPLPTGNYTVMITTYEPIAGNQIGCLSVKAPVIGLGLDACSYTSTVEAEMSGTLSFLKDENENTIVHLGPRGPDGVDLGPNYNWGTFKSVIASPDLVGYAFRPDNLVWGLRGSQNPVDADLFNGTLVIGWLPNATDYEHAKLVYQGIFSWSFSTSSEGKRVFKSGTVALVPGYTYPEAFPYPLNIGNLGPFEVTQDQSRMTFTISASKSWCRCNCENGGLGRDGLLAGKKSSGLSGFEKGTIAICVVGGVIFIAAIIFIVKIRRSKPRPVVYDDADLLDPQKPDYGSLAINEAFEAEQHEYN